MPNCFRCGVCCVEYQPRLDLAEAGRIAHEMGISLDEFLKKYADESWPGTQSFLLRKHRRACIFLKRMPDGKQAICLIHPFRPSSCREWLAGWYKRECQEGLTKYWGLTVGPSGEIQGTSRRIKSFKHRQHKIPAQYSLEDLEHDLKVIGKRRGKVPAS